MRQRKIVAFAGFIILSLIPLQAQWEVGGLIGLNLSSISVKPGSSNEDISGRLGFGIGAVVDRPLNDRISVHAEPMFLQKGGKITRSDVTAVFKVSYLELPIMIKYAFQSGSSLIPYAMAGPSIGFLTGAKLDFTDGQDQDEKDNTNSLDFGLGFGGGVGIPYGNLTFFAETRYVLGLANINKESDESTVKNHGLQILVGVTLPVGSK